ncbi:MAG TPA: hypothetical protein GX005_03305 [Bacteroidales bacterium]|nr:hypothetical protein [Bacteroidales bacterium]
MKSRRIKLMALLTFGLVVGTTVGVFGNSVIKNITAQINPNLKMELNNKSFKPKDANGKEMKPITYQGSTYLPVRALGEALGVDITFDSVSQTIGIGGGSTPAVIVPKNEWKPLDSSMVGGKYFNNFSFTNNKDLLSINNKTYQHGLFMPTLSAASSSGGSISTKGDYREISFVAWTEGISEEILLTIKDYETGEVYSVIKATKTPQTIVVDIRNSKEIRLLLSKQKNKDNFKIGDFKLR